MPLPAGPRQSPLIQMWRWMREPFRFLDDCAERHGEAFTVRMPTLPPMAVFASPEAVQNVFNAAPDEVYAGETNAPLRPFLGEHSLLMIDGPRHLRQRKLMMPPFHGERMVSYGAQMIEAAQRSIDRWPLGTPFAVHGPMQEITLEIILRSVFGFEEGASLTRAGEVLTRGVNAALWPPLLLPFMQKDLGPLSPWGRFVRASAKADEMMSEEIRRRRAQPDPGRNDVLSMLLGARDDAGEPMTDQELRDQLGTLLVAGHETTATTLAWALRWILADADLLRRLREELGTVHDLSPERVAALPLLDATVRETLRLQPVIPIVGRTLQKPATVGGFSLDTGTRVMCAIYLAQRRPAVFPEPARFLPDRWLGDLREPVPRDSRGLGRKFTPYEWFPFGGGVRRCIGMAFALYEMKMVLGAVLSRASLRLLPGREIVPVRRSITIAPSRGVEVILDQRSAPYVAA